MTTIPTDAGAGLSTAFGGALDLVAGGAEDGVPASFAWAERAAYGADGVYRSFQSAVALISVNATLGVGETLSITDVVVEDAADSLGTGVALYLESTESAVFNEAQPNGVLQIPVNFAGANVATRLKVTPTFSAAGVDKATIHVNWVRSGSPTTPAE